MPLPPILQEDETFIAFDKPSGMLVAPDRWDKQRENLMGLVHDKMGHGVANVHRLDADTSELLNNGGIFKRFVQRLIQRCHDLGRQPGRPKNTKPRQRYKAR